MADDVWQIKCDAKEEITKLEPRVDLLHEVLGFGRFAEVTMTPDGFFLGRVRGDIGFNHFLGQPSDAAKDRTKVVFDKLSKCSQGYVLAVIRGKGIKPRDIGIR